MLEIIEHQQQALVPQAMDQGVQRGHPWYRPQSQCREQVGGDQVGIAHPGQWHPADPLCKHRPEMGCYFQRQACFATASRPNQGDEAHLVVAQELRQPLHFPVPPNESCHGGRQDTGGEGGGGRRERASRRSSRSSVRVEFAQGRAGPLLFTEAPGRHIGQFEQGKHLIARRERAPFGQQRDDALDLLLGHIGVSGAMQFATEDGRMQRQRARQVLLGVANDPQILSYPMAKVGALHRCVPFCLHAEENPASSVCSFCTIRVENEPRESYLRANFEYIETFYNRRRRHSTLQYLSPFAYEQVRC